MKNVSQQVRNISLRPSDAVPDEDQSLDRGPDLLRAIRVFQPFGQRDNYIGYSVPVYVRLALDAVVAQLGGHISVSHVGVWSLAVGVARLRALPDVRAICSARAELLRAGCDTDYIDHFNYAPRGGRRLRLYLRYVDPADIGCVGDMATGLGLEISSVASTAIEAGLVGLPLRGDIPRHVEDDLRDFRRALRQRAAIVEDLRARAMAAPEPPRWQLEWENLE